MSTSDAAQKVRSWTAKYIPRPGSSGGRPSTSSRPGSASGRSASGGGIAGSLFRMSTSSLPTPEEGRELATRSPPASYPPSPVLAPISLPPSNTDSGRTTPVSRAGTFDSTNSSRPSTPKRRSFTNLISTPHQALEQEASQLLLNALERTNTSHQNNPSNGKSSDHNGKSSGFGRSLSSMMGGFPSLSLTRTSTRETTYPSNGDDKEIRGRSLVKMKRVKSASQAPPENDVWSRSQSRARSQSPFSFRRFRSRESSPVPQAIPLTHSDTELSDTASVRPRSTSFTDDHDSGDEMVGETDAETDEEDTSNDDGFDPVTERNTERNALIAPVTLDGTIPPEAEDPDPLGEGVNVVVPPEPYFPSTLNSSNTIRGKRNPRRRKSVKHHEPLEFQTSRPIFQRDRCTITITQGNPEASLGERRQRRYVVASDLSEESRYAVEWGIGTVLRDGDSMLIVTVVENEAKVDPQIPNAADRATKLRSQQERQGLAYILVRQATSLLQRTRLNVTVSCQAWHAKNARHMLLDIVDHNEPTMLIVGSRGLGQLKGILLGSTSHYLIQKCSVPVMVARRRLKRPPRRSAHLSTHRTHVSLAEAGIDRVAAKVDQDVQVMREEIKRDDDRRDGGPGSRDQPLAVEEVIGEAEADEDVAEDEADEDPDENNTATVTKVAGQ